MFFLCAPSYPYDEVIYYTYYALLVQFIATTAVDSIILHDLQTQVWGIAL